LATVCIRLDTEKLTFVPSQEELMKHEKAWSLLAVVSLGLATSSLASKAPEASSPLKSDEIRKVLVGKLITYEPPGSADMGIHEEFHPDGIWRGILYGRGPIPFSGKWSIEADQICVAADRRTAAERWHPGKFCRNVWRNRKSGELQLNYLRDQSSGSRKMGLQTITVHDPPRSK